MWILSWIFGASWDGRWLRINLAKIQRLGGVYGRWMRARRGTLGDHDIVTASKYCGKWLVDENKW